MENERIGSFGGGGGDLLAVPPGTATDKGLVTLGADCVMVMKIGAPQNVQRGLRTEGLKPKDLNTKMFKT